MSIAGWPEPLVLEEFNGLWTEFEIQDIPANYSPGPCKNINFTKGGVSTREGIGASLFSITGGNILHSTNFFFADSRYYMFLSSNRGIYYVLYDLLNDTVLAGPTLILTAAVGTTHFVVETFGDFIYIFTSDGSYGTGGPYVWDISQLPTVQVDLATIPPVAIGAMAAANGGAGVCSPGVHKFKVVFVTRTGYESSPTTGELSFTVPAGGCDINLTTIPTWTAGAGHVNAECVARIILMTEADREEFFDSGLTLNDNTTTSGTVNISDDELNQGRSFNDHEQFVSPLPFFSGASVYKNYLAAQGDSAHGSRVWVSQPGSPQSFREDVGFIEVHEDDGLRAVVNFQLGDILYVVKALGIFAYQANGSSPDTWSEMTIAEDIGTISISGVSCISDQGFAIILDFKGLYVFTGPGPQKLSQRIQPTWEGMNPDTRTAEIHIDTKNRRIFALVPIGDDTRPTQVFMCDYENGWKSPRWTIWDTAGPKWQSMIVDTLAIVLSLTDGTVHRMSAAAFSDNGYAIESVNRTGNLEPRKYGVNLFGGITVHAVGVGTLALNVYGPDGTLIITPTGFTLSTAPEKDLFRGVNIRKERVFLQFGTNAVGSYFNVSRLAMWSRQDGDRAF